MWQAIGLLTLTGVLWGCTNPFIKQGTKGLRDVQSNSWLGQAWAEITFLLGNWRYVVPWVVNQCGSLAYLAAVQRAPLSLAVPAANGLAFACTALTGVAASIDQPLQPGVVFNSGHSVDSGGHRSLLLGQEYVIQHAHAADWAVPRLYGKLALDRQLA